MRLAVLADVHGNIWALEAVLTDAHAHGVDALVNAGDLLSGPLEPAATADLLMSLDLPTVAGNHERQLLACEHGRGGASDEFALEHTTGAHREWIRALPATVELDGGVFLCHGTPASDRTYLLEDVSSGVARPAAQAVVEAHVSGVAQALIVCGHSHLPGRREVSGGRCVVNPGSVGLPAYDDDQPCPHVMATGRPEARYALCELGPKGWTVTERVVAYDHAKAAATARRHGRTDWAHWLETGTA